MSDLTTDEQRNVRAALRFLRYRAGGWVAVADALHCGRVSLRKVMGGRVVSASLAIRVARLVQVSIDDLLTGAWALSRICPHCGRPTEGTDEEFASTASRST